jgi:hypothetical protein
MNDTGELLGTPTMAVAWGEVIDRLTILEIKSVRIEGEAALANIRHELAITAAVARPALERIPALADCVAGLREVNGALWEIEDELREKEAAKQFDEAFIALARSVYRTNDERAAIKRQINELTRSGIVEEKSYKPY